MEENLLAKGLNFCPDASLDTFETIKDLNLFARKLYYKSLYSKETDFTRKDTKESNKALDNLLTLLEE